MSVDFHQETKWKRAAAKHLAQSCQAAYRARRNAKIDAENWTKRRCASIAAMVRTFWSNLKALSQYETISAQKSSTESGLLMRPDTPESVEDELPREVQLLVDDQKKPLQRAYSIFSDVHGASETRKASLADKARAIQEKISDKQIKHSLGIELFPHQRKTINWLLESRANDLSSFICHEYGLGRRTQILVYLEQIAPCSLIGSWVQVVFYYFLVRFLRIIQLVNH